MSARRPASSWLLLTSLLRPLCLPYLCVQAARASVRRHGGRRVATEGLVGRVRRFTVGGRRRDCDAPLPLARRRVPRSVPLGLHATPAGPNPLTVLLGSLVGCTQVAAWMLPEEGALQGCSETSRRHKEPAQKVYSTRTCPSHGACL